MSIYLEGHGDFVSKSILGILAVIMRVIGVINLLTKSHDPPSRGRKGSPLGYFQARLGMWLPTAV